MRNTEKQTILYLADDNKDSLGLIIALEGKFEVDGVYDIKSAKARLKRKCRPLLVAIDYNSFLEDTFAFVCFVKDHYPEVAVVVVTGKGQSEKDIAYCAKILKSDGVIKGPILDVEAITKVVNEAISNVSGLRGK